MTDAGSTWRLSDFVELDHRQCLDYLQQSRRGHLAATRSALPIVIPVELTWLAGRLLIASSRGDGLDLSPGSVVALEVDEPGPLTSTNWSVLAQGVLEPVQVEQVARAHLAFRFELLSGWQRTLD